MLKRELGPSTLATLTRAPVQPKRLLELELKERLAKGVGRRR